MISNTCKYIILNSEKLIYTYNKPNNMYVYVRKIHYRTYMCV